MALPARDRCVLLGSVVVPIVDAGDAGFSVAEDARDDESFDAQRGEPGSDGAAQIVDMPRLGGCDARADSFDPPLRITPTVKTRKYGDLMFRRNINEAVREPTQYGASNLAFDDTDPDYARLRLLLHRQLA